MINTAISVILPVYNAARYLRPAVESVLQQTAKDFELIAVDDGSTDESKTILEHYARTDPRVRVISRPNTGIVGALNDGLAAARSEFIARMDGDDIASPERFARQIAFLHSHRDCVAVGTTVDIIDSWGAIVDRYSPPTEHSAIETELLKGNGGALVHPSAMFRAEAIRAVNGYDVAFCKAEDLDLYLRLSRRGRLANLPYVGLRYRHHVKSTNFQHREKQLQLIGQILRRERTLRRLPAAALENAGHSDLPPGRLHAQWACSALAHGTRFTAIRHSLAAVSKDVRDPQSWRALRYVLTARRAHVPSA